MSIITLTSDWKHKAHYQGVMKGRLLALHHALTIVDISHEIEAHQLGQAAFVVRNALPFFPDNSIHIIDIGTASASFKPVIIRKNNYFLLCHDNGIYSLIDREEPDEVIAINKFTIEHPSFPAIDIFAPAAIHLLQKKPAKALGEPYKLTKENMPLRPTIEKDAIIGHVIFLDGYGNAITNITKELFMRVGEGRPVEILVQSNRNKITGIVDYYDQVENGDLLALFNISSLLEIAINQGHAGELLGLTAHSSIMVKFRA